MMPFLIVNSGPAAKAVAQVLAWCCRRSPWDQVEPLAGSRVMPRGDFYACFRDIGESPVLDALANGNDVLILKHSRVKIQLLLEPDKCRSTCVSLAVQYARQRIHDDKEKVTPSELRAMIERILEPLAQLAHLAWEHVERARSYAAMDEWKDETRDTLAIALSKIVTILTNQRRPPIR